MLLRSFQRHIHAAGILLSSLSVVADAAADRYRWLYPLSLLQPPLRLFVSACIRSALTTQQQHYDAQILLSDVFRKY